MKSKTMVYLEREQLKALRARARAQRISLAELMRRLVAHHLREADIAPPVPTSAYEKLVALGASGRADVGDRHDAHLAEALRRDHAR
jgi:hypothetical protein